MTTPRRYAGSTAASSGSATAVAVSKARVRDRAERKERVTPALRGRQEWGVLARPAGNPNLRLPPPLVWERAQVDELIAALGAMLA